MNIKFFFVFLSIFISSYTFAKSENLWSYSLGQFDANDSYDSFEQRIEYLYEKNLIESYKLMPFVGLMVNAESGKYFYTGLRKILIYHLIGISPQVLLLGIMIEEVVKI